MKNVLFSELIKEKQEKANYIRKKYSFSNHNKLVGLIILSDDIILKNLISALHVLPSDFIVVSNSKFTNFKNVAFVDQNITSDIDAGYDFVIFDELISSSFDYYTKKGVVPIINNLANIGSIFREFNPIINDGNSFIYSEKNEWSIFYSLVRCLENMKFPQDRKNLVRNVFEV